MAFETYQNLTMRTALGVHEATFAALSQLRPPLATALDLGACEGAFSLRLKEAGYRCQAAEIEPGRFAVDDVPCHGLDLNADFAAALPGATYDVIVAQEIIEYLENPRHFLRQCLALLSPGGVLMLSTPNIDDVYSRIRFMLSGRFSFFTDGDYRRMGHITPLASWQLAQLFDELGLHAVTHTYNRPFRRLFWPRCRSDWTKLIGGLVFWPLTVGVRGGQVHVYALRRRAEA